MRRTLVFSLLTILMFCGLGTSVVAAASEIKIGVLAPRGELKALTRWSEFGKFMSEELGRPVKMVPLPPSKLPNSAKQEEVDFMLANPLQTAFIEENYGARPLLTLNKKHGPRFAGLIIAKKGSGIHVAEDLRGKKVMSLKFNSAAGAYIFQAYHLKRKGINVHKDFASLTEGKKQDDLVLAVRAGVIDAAFVRTGLLEAMEREGKIKISDFIVVDQRTGDGFPLAHSTALYPEWYLSALSKTSRQMGKRVRRAAMKLTPNMRAAKTAKIKGFVDAVSLKGMKAAMKALRIPPYDKRRVSRTER